MIVSCSTEQFSISAICDWLRDGTTARDLDLTTDRPWARTYKITNRQTTRFLKLLPSVQRGALAAMPKLWELFPNTVPRVLMVDAANGLILMEDHGGEGHQGKGSVEVQQRTLATYAKIQATVAKQTDLVEMLPAIQLNEQVPALLAFLNPNPSEASVHTPAHAKDFFDVEKCQYYYELFAARAEKLSQLIDAAKCLPPSINHCDLRPSNVATRKNGDLVIYDWDEAVAGPAGLSLHNSFSGCSVPCEILLSPDKALLSEFATARMMLETYMRTLVAEGYCDRETLIRGLPGAICAGVIQFVTSFARFAPPDDQYREDIRYNLRKRLNDLLELADLLQSDSRETALQLVEDYEKRERPEHACRVLRCHVERDPGDMEAIAQLTTLLDKADDDEVAPTFKRLLTLHPESAGLHRFYGMWLLEDLNLEAARDHLRLAIQFGKNDESLTEALNDVEEFENAMRQADEKGKLPTICVSTAEQQLGKMKFSKRRLGARLFRKYGTLVIENAFSEPLVEEMHREYLHRYSRYFVEERHADALRVGNKRYMVTVDVDGVFNKPDVYANPHVLPIIERVLDDKMILGGFVSVCSLPGAEHMHIHKDHPALFPESDDPDSVPSFAITAIVPMLGFNPVYGTTRVMKRSHRFASKIADEMETQDPCAPRGSVLLMDYRLTHQGRGNRSDQVRPILTMIYHRAWFRDIKNYGKQDALIMSDEAFEKVPQEYRHLFSWSRSRNK
jgi:ectoine hydroxylase-related dioxygenase (phytanoyl-CoA dioxygenase family)